MPKKKTTKKKTNQDTVASLIEKRKKMKAGAKEAALKPGIHELQETESLKVQNLSLQQELLRRRMNDLQNEMGAVVDQIRDRLQLPKGWDLQVQQNMTQVLVIGKETA